MKPLPRIAPSFMPLKGLTIAWCAGLVLSLWVAEDRLTWALEVFPALIALVVMWRSCRFIELTALLYALITIHGLILMLGGAYTYAHVPLGFWMQDWFGFTRNNYDKIGHFAQGFVPAIVAREVLIRVSGLTSRRLVIFLCISICLGFSAFYELIEWGAALAMGQGADEFLGTQGDPWDTQSDMAFALLGACVALLTLERRHDRQMAAMKITSA